MEVNQYKVTYLKHGQEKINILSTIAGVAKIQNSGFKIIKISPQTVVDQLPSAKVVNQINLEIRFEIKKLKIMELKNKLNEAEKLAKNLRMLLSIESRRPH